METTPLENTPLNLSFGKALEHLKAGRRVARKGWNGKGMWLILIPAEMVGELYEHDTDDCIGMKTAGGTMQPGWLASQADLLSEDWGVLP